MSGITSPPTLRSVASVSADSTASSEVAGSVYGVPTVYWAAAPLVLESAIRIGSISRSKPSGKFAGAPTTLRPTELRQEVFFGPASVSNGRRRPAACTSARAKSMLDRRSAPGRQSM